MPTDKTKKQKIKDTMQMQSNDYDKFWLYLSGTALSGMMDDAKGLSQEDKAQLKADPNELLSEKPDMEYDPMNIDSENTDTVSRCKNMMFLMGVFEAKLAMELGSEQVNEEQSIGARELNEQKRVEKAAYLVKNGGSKIVRMYNSFLQWQSNVIVMQKMQATAHLAAPGGVDTETTMDKLADMLSLRGDERTDFFNYYRASKNDKALAVFKRELKKLIDDEKLKPQNKRNLNIMKSDPQKNVDVMAHLVSSCGEYIVQKYRENGFAAVRDSLVGSEKEMLVKGVKYRADKYLTFDNIKDWINEKGADQAAKKKIQNINKSARQIVDNITSEKPVKIRSTRGMTDAFREELYVSRPEFLSGIIAKFESTKKGTSYDRFLWHNKNSDEYEAMLKSVKALEKAVFEKKTGEAADRKEEMLKKCYAYIAGKETKMVHDFGKERFNLAMMLIHRYDTRENFDALCNKVNRLRDSEDILAENHMDAGALVAFSNQYGLDALGKKRLHEATGKIITVRDPDKRKQFCVMEGLFLPKAKIDPVINADLKQSYKDKLKEYDKPYHRISDDVIKKNARPETPGLSGRDFAAIAYGASLSKNAVDKSKSSFPNIEGVDDIPFAFSSRYTSRLMNKSGINPEEGKVTSVIQYGRDRADNAMKEYAKGNKKPLGAILANALVVITDKFRIKNEVDDEVIADCEMAARMCKMLLRDEALMKAAIKSNQNFSMENVRMVSCMNTACELHAKYLSANKALEDVGKPGKKELPEEVKISLMTDVVAYKSIQGCMSNRTSSLANNQEYKSRKSEIENARKNELDPVEKIRDDINRRFPNGHKNITKKEEKKFSDNQKKEKEIKEKYDGKIRLLQRRYVKYDENIDKLKETNASESLRHSASEHVQKMIKKMVGPQEKLTAANIKEVLRAINTQLIHGVKPEENEPQRQPQARAPQHN